jgi:hypothetical protein
MKSKKGNRDLIYDKIWERPWKEILKDIESIPEEDKKMIKWQVKRTCELWHDGSDYWRSVDQAMLELRERKHNFVSRSFR